jgi:predicted transcriptional regulator
MWKNLIQHLADQGVSQYAMAKAAGVNQSTICRLAAGDGEPRYSVAMALIALGGGVDELRTKGLIVTPAANDTNAAQAAQQAGAQ